VSDSSRAIIPLETILVCHGAFLCKELAYVRPLFQLHIDAFLLFLLLIAVTLRTSRYRCSFFADLPSFFGVVTLVWIIYFITLIRTV
jgi:hypothetical protein